MYVPSNSISGYLSEKMKTLNLKRYLNLMFIAKLFAIAKTWKQTKCLLMDG